MNGLTPSRSAIDCRACRNLWWATAATPVPRSGSTSGRQHVWEAGARPAIPPRRNEAAVACPAWIYDNRNAIERLWARLKEWRVVTGGYEKTACSFMGALSMAAAPDWLRH